MTDAALDRCVRHGAICTRTPKQMIATLGMQQIHESLALQDTDVASAA